MDEPVELLELYFNWLAAKVIDITQTSPGLTYWKLFKVMYTTAFVWLLQGDDNRCEDGKDLRNHFLIEAGIPVYPEWGEEGCSVLEMLVAFARRAELMTDRPSHEWFWEFINNLNLREFNDANYEQYPVDVILDKMVWRTYDANGRGGIFPINNPKFDQTKVEVWNQFCDYLIDQEL